MALKTGIISCHGNVLTQEGLSKEKSTFKGLTTHKTGYKIIHICLLPLSTA
jgi:hypothetical protein